MVAPPPPPIDGGRLAEYPTERRVQWLAIASLAGAAIMDALLVGFDPVRYIGYDIPGVVALALVAVAIVVGVVAVVKRSLVLVGVAIAALLVPALGERPWEITAWRFVGSIAFGFLTLAYGELVHMTIRYEKYHKVVDERRTSAAGLDHATEEYLKTFTSVFGLSAAITALVGIVFFLLLTLGPAQHRASIDFRSFYGLAGAAFLVFGTLVVIALARDADWSWPRPKPRPREGADAEATTIGSPEVDSHVLD